MKLADAATRDRIASLPKLHGAVKAYVKVRTIHKRASLNLLWTLRAARKQV